MSEGQTEIGGAYYSGHIWGSQREASLSTENLFSLPLPNQAPYPQICPLISICALWLTHTTHYTYNNNN